MKISLRFLPKPEGTRYNLGITSYSVQDHCSLIIERADGSRMPLKGILSAAGAMLDLLSICCNETPVLINFSVHLENDEPRPPAKVYLRMRGHDVEKRKGPPYPALTLQGLGGMEGVARWITVREQYKPAVAFLTSNWYNDRSYNQDQFFRMYTAVESLWARENKRDKAMIGYLDLAGFVEKAIPDFSRVTGRSSKEWAIRAKEIRDRQVVHSDPASDVVTDGRTLYVMKDILYVAGASFLLREMGMIETQIKEYIDECGQSLLLNEQMMRSEMLGTGN